MKQVQAFSLDSEVLARLRQRTMKSEFKNKSHLVEEAIKRFLEVPE
ncbi:ribbon-helix-helix protein, CopG family [Nanoarchaeota archaeon]